MAALATIGAIAALASAGVTAVGTIAGGQAQADFYEQQAVAQKQAADFEAAQLDIRAKNEKATGQREMLALRRNKKLALSTLQARSAGSGFMATDPTSLAIADEIEKYGTLQEQTALYGGSSAANELNLASAARRFSGARALEAGYTQAGLTRTSSLFSAGGTILGGISSFADKYNRPAQRPATGGRYG